MYLDLLGGSLFIDLFLKLEIRSTKLGSLQDVYKIRAPDNLRKKGNKSIKAIPRLFLPPILNASPLNLATPTDVPSCDVYRHNYDVYGGRQDQGSRDTFGKGSTVREIITGCRASEAPAFSL